jgi:hypothetical protein
LLVRLPIALPYLYPKLSQATVAATHTVVRVDPQELMDRIAERIARQTAQTTIEHELEQLAEAADEFC